MSTEAGPSGTPPPSFTILPVDPSSSAKPELPWAFVDCPTDVLVILISHMLQLLMQHNDQVVLTPDALTRFHSRASPGISVVEYLRRIVKYTSLEKMPLLSLLAYIDITCQHLPTFTLSSLTVHRFLIAGVCAGSKAQCDVFCTNSHYAKVGGIKAQELNALEREFLKVTQWNLCCTADLLQRYYTSLIRSHGGYEQASAPSETPFLAFPRSLSKPPSAASSEARADDVDEDMPDAREPKSLEAKSGSAADMEEGDSPSEGRYGSNISVNDTQRGRSNRRGSAEAREGKRQRRGSGMDVDLPDDYSAASSSIPSSRRSSIRGSRGSRRGSTLSVTIPDSRLASPRVDASNASGEHSSSGPLHPRLPLASASDMAVIDHQTTVPPPPHAKPPETEYNHHHGAGHPLKTFIGGIFGHGHNRRKSRSPQRHLSNHTAATQEYPSNPTLTSRPVGFAGSRDTRHTVPTAIPERPAQLLQPELDEPLQNPEPPPFPSETLPTPQRAQFDITRSPRATEEDYPTPIPREVTSPGLAKPVTPRIRTRGERSTDAVARVTLGGREVVADLGREIV